MTNKEMYAGVSPAQHQEQGGFGNVFKESFVRTIKGIGQQMQYDCYDYETGRVSRQQSSKTIRAALEQIHKQADALPLPISNLGPGTVNFLSSVVAPYVYNQAKSAVISEIAVESLPVLFSHAAVHSRRDA